MCVPKKKKSKRNKDSHTKNFNRQNFSFVNYNSEQKLSINYTNQHTNSVNGQGVFFIITSVLFLYFFLPLAYHTTLQEFNYDILLDVSSLMGAAVDDNYGSSLLGNPNARDLLNLRSTLNKIKLFDYCL